LLLASGCPGRRTSNRKGREGRKGKTNNKFFAVDFLQIGEERELLADGF
jgi:hypothetical protein